MSQELLAALSAAKAELCQILSTTGTVTAQLEGGVDLETAYLIIDRYWDGNEASLLKTRLSGSFPQQNGQVLLGAPFSDKLGVALSMPETRDYFDRVFPEVIKLVQSVYDRINSADLNDPEALMKLNEFRKEPARFVDFVKDGWWYGREDTIEGKTTSWQELRDETESIDSGNYLFLTDYNQEIRAAQKCMEKSLLGYGSLDNRCMGSVADSVRHLLGMVCMTGLFAQYVSGLNNG